MFAIPIPRNPKYGWIPDLPDQRDLQYKQLAPSITLLPGAIDLRSKCTPIENQGDLGCCTACALVGNLEFIKKMKLNKIIDFSRLFLYYNERLLRHTQNSDSGSSIRDGIKTLVKTGDCLENLWPYDVAQFAIKPPLKAYQQAQNMEITKYYRLKAANEMKHTLSLGFPFVFGFAVYESFESLIVTKTGVVPLPKPNERVVGGHAVMVVGYDDSKNYFIVRNSWGVNWGDKGYFYMPYDYLTNTKLSSDFWTIRAME